MKLVNKIVVLRRQNCSFFTIKFPDWTFVANNIAEGLWSDGQTCWIVLLWLQNCHKLLSWSFITNKTVLPWRQNCCSAAAKLFNCYHEIAGMNFRSNQHYRGTVTNLLKCSFIFPKLSPIVELTFLKNKTVLLGDSSDKIGEQNCFSVATKLFNCSEQNCRSALSGGQPCWNVLL